MKKKKDQLRRSKRPVVRVRLMTDETSEEEEDPYCVSDDEDDCPCLYCNDLFSRSKSKEAWLQCQVCEKWAHAECAGVQKKTKMFTCDLCKD